jgi:hypothetical protein
MKRLLQGEEFFYDRALKFASSLRSVKRSKIPYEIGQFLQL